MLGKYLNQVNSVEIREWINTTLNATLKKRPENQGEIEHILDYLQSDKAPKRLRKMSYDQAMKSSQKWVESLAKKGKDVDDTSEIEVIKKYKNGFRFVRLLGKSAYEREGKLMAHCVGSYHDKTQSRIYSLRDEKNEPHCTIEVLTEGKTINQIKGKGNGSIHPRYIKMVLSILKHFDMEVRPSEMSNLGYIHLEPDEVEIVNEVSKDTGKEYTFFKYKENTYLFKGC